MKKITLFFFSCFLIQFQNANAQNWQLLPFNQLDYFASPDTSTSFNNIYEYKNDSITIAGDTKVLHFNRFPVAEDHSNCIYTTKIMLGDTLEFDSLVEWNNSYHYFFISDTAVFPTLALPGDSVIINCANGGSNFNRIKLICDSLKSTTVFDVADSVKYFSLHAFNGNAPVNYYNNYTYELSKTFGLLNFIPFRYWLYHPDTITLPTYAIKGLETASDTLGFHLPTFNDYLHYHVGDIYKWFDFSYNEVGYPNGYFRDSITAVQYLNDTVKLSYNEQAIDYRDTPFTYTTSVMTEDFAKNDYENVIDKTPPHLGFSLYSQSSYRIYYNSISLDSCLDTTFSFGTGSGIEPPCYYIPPFEYSQSFTFSTAAGYIGYAFWDGVTPGNGDYNIVGFKTALASCGDYLLTAGIPQLPANSNNLTAYPNPTSKQLTISSNQFFISQLQIENVLGQTVLQKTFDNGLQKQIIDVSALPAGIYFYHVTDSESHALTGKFVKE